MDEITIGARLRTLRRWRGMTQVELAGLADLSPSFVSMVEHDGVRAGPASTTYMATSEQTRTGSVAYCYWPCP